MGKKSDKKQSKAAARNDEDMQVPDDERFTSVLSAPVFKNLSKEKHKVEIDDRFKSMLTDDRFKVLPGGSVDAYGRKKKKKGTNDRALEELYHVDEDENGDDNDDEDDHQSTSAKESKNKNQAPKGGKAEMEKRLDYLTKLARGEISDDGSEDDSSDEDDSEGEDDEDEDEEDEVMEVDPEEWEAIQLLNGKSPLDVPEEEDVETGEATRRISILNCDWENIKADDLMMILQSFCPPGRQVQTITVYPSDFGKQRMAEEAKYGPRGIWKSDEQEEMSEMEESDGEDDDSNAENESLYDQIEANEGLEDGDDDEEVAEDQEDEEESEEERPAPKKGVKGKKGYGEFNRKQGAVGLVLHDELVEHKHKKKPKQPESDEEDEQGEDEEEHSEGEDEDNEEDDDEDNESGRQRAGSSVYSGSRHSGSKKSNSDYNAVALRQYELSKLRYYFAIAECDSVDTANALYEALDGVEFENSAMALEIRFVPDDLDLSDREVRDTCSHAPDARRYKPPEFVVNAKQHTNVTCTWDEGEKDREKTLTNFSAWRNLKESDFAQYLASESEDDAEESEEEEEEEEAADSDDQSAGDAGKSVKSSADRKKEKARALRKMLLGDDGSSDDDSAHDDFFNESLDNSDADSGDEVVQKTASKPSAGKAKSKSTSVDELGENDELVMTYVPEAEKDQVLQRKREREGGLTPYEIEMAKSADKKKARKAARKAAVEEKIRREKDEELMRQEQLKKERKLRKEKGEEIDAEDLVESYRGRMQQQSKDMQQERKKKVNKKTPLTAIEDDLDRKQQQNTHRAVVTDASFTVDTKDDRFARVFAGDAKFGIDRTAPEFRATPGMKKILAEQRKRRQDDDTHRSSTTPPAEVDTSKPAAKKARVEESTSAAAPSTNVDVNFLANKLKSKFQKK